MEQAEKRSFAVYERGSDRVETIQIPVNPQGASIGRIVHYVNLGDRDGKFPPTVQSATVTGINDDGTVSLRVDYRTGVFDLPSCEYREHYTRGCWSWPPLLIGRRPPSPPDAASPA